MAYAIFVQQNDLDGILTFELVYICIEYAYKHRYEICTYYNLKKF